MTMSSKGVQLLQLTEETFKEYINKSGGLNIVHFRLPGSVASITMSTTLKRLVREMEGPFRVAEMVQSKGHTPKITFFKYGTRVDQCLDGDCNVVARKLFQRPEGFKKRSKPLKKEASRAEPSQAQPEGGERMHPVGCEPHTATAVSGEVEFAPIRPLGEFLLDRARFELPPIKDMPKWNKRVVTNLLYFQTNYGIISLFLALFIGSFHARDVIIGFSAVALLGTVLVFSLTKSPKFMQFRAERPYIVLVAIVISAYYFITVLPSVVTLMFTFAVPLLIILTHASIRLRNLSAKVNQKLEVTGLRSTVMAHILSACGIGLGY